MMSKAWAEEYVAAVGKAHALWRIGSKEPNIGAGIITIQKTGKRAHRLARIYNTQVALCSA